MTAAFLLLALAASPAGAAARKAAAPAPETLLRRAAAAPSAHEGVLLVETFGPKPASRRVRVAFSPPSKWRRETLDANGATALLAVSDGRVDWLYDAARKRAWSGEAADPDYKQLGREDETDLIAENYAVSAATGEPVAGRSTWRLELRAREDGRLERRLWLDRRAGLVLRGQAFQDGTLISDARFESVRFERPKAGVFRFAPPDGTATARRSEADYMAAGQAKAVSGLEPRSPRWLPSGFVFESSDVLERGGKSILHARFSDGINALSLFQCPKGVRLDFGAKRAEKVKLAAGEGELAAAPEGRVLAWESGGARFMLVGRLSADALKRVADSIP